MKLESKIKVLSIFGLSLSLVACGGSGGSANSEATVSTTTVPDTTVPDTTVTGNKNANVCSPLKSGYSLEEVQRTAKAYNQFSVDLYKAIATDENTASDDNLLMSPMSVAHSFSMMLAGAKGKTAMEIGNTLYLGSELPTEGEKESYYGSKELYQSISHLQNYLGQVPVEGKSTLSINNAFWPSDHIEVKAKFKNTLSQCYQSTIMPLNYTEADKAAETINNWVYEKTNQLLKKIISPESLSGNTTSVLTNAVYFKGKWQKPFDLEETEKQAFTFVDGSGASVEHQIDMMSQSNKFKYSKGEKLDGVKVDALELSYDDGQYSIFFIVPEQTVSGVEAKLTSNMLAELMEKVQGTKERTVSVTIPRFSLNKGKTLNNYLADLGMKEAFQGSANFSGISTVPSSIDEVKHRAAISIDEEGTVGAAVTSIVSMGRSISPEFTVNKPSIFVIRDNNSKGILFIGRYVKPKAS